MTITMTLNDFNKRWYFLRFMVPTSMRKEVLKTLAQNKNRINEENSLEIEVPRNQEE